MCVWVRVLFRGVRVCVSVHACGGKGVCDCMGVDELSQWPLSMGIESCPPPHGNYMSHPMRIEPIPAYWN